MTWERVLVLSWLLWLGSTLGCFEGLSLGSFLVSESLIWIEIRNTSPRKAKGNLLTLFFGANSSAILPVVEVPGRELRVFTSNKTLFCSQFPEVSPPVVFELSFASSELLSDGGSFELKCLGQNLDVAPWQAGQINQVLRRNVYADTSLWQPGNSAQFTPVTAHSFPQDTCFPGVWDLDDDRETRFGPQVSLEGDYSTDLGFSPGVGSVLRVRVRASDIFGDNVQVWCRRNGQALNTSTSRKPDTLCRHNTHETVLPFLGAAQSCDTVAEVWGGSIALSTLLFARSEYVHQWLGREFTSVYQVPLSVFVVASDSFAASGSVEALPSPSQCFTSSDCYSFPCVDGQCDCSVDFVGNGSAPTLSWLCQQEVVPNSGNCQQDVTSPVCLVPSSVYLFTGENFITEVLFADCSGGASSSGLNYTQSARKLFSLTDQAWSMISIQGLAGHSDMFTFNASSSGTFRVLYELYDEVGNGRDCSFQIEVFNSSLDFQVVHEDCPATENSSSTRYIRLLQGQNQTALPNSLLPAPAATSSSAVEVRVAAQTLYRLDFTNGTFDFNSLQLLFSEGSYLISYTYFSAVSPFSNQSCFYEVVVLPAYRANFNQAETTLMVIEQVFSAGHNASTMSLVLEYIFTSSYPFSSLGSATSLVSNESTTTATQQLSVDSQQPVAEQFVYCDENRPDAGPESNFSISDLESFCQSTYRLMANFTNCDMLDATMLVIHPLRCIPSNGTIYHYSQGNPDESSVCLDEAPPGQANININARNFCHMAIGSVNLRGITGVGDLAWAQQRLGAKENEGQIYGHYFDLTNESFVEFVGEVGTDLCVLLLLETENVQPGDIQFESLEFSFIEVEWVEQENSSLLVEAENMTFYTNENMTNVQAACFTLPPYLEDNSTELVVTVYGSVSYTAPNFRRRALVSKENMPLALSARTRLLRRQQVPPITGPSFALWKAWLVCLGTVLVCLRLRKKCEHKRLLAGF